MDPVLKEICEARLGKVLKGKWKLERILGVGGMAAVYEGVHKIGRNDAIKILHPEVARQPDLKRRFEIEASATNRFSHPGAVEIRDYDLSEDGCPFLVMEMLQGESLGEKARRLNGVPTDDLLMHADELLDVLAAAHREGIVHRDIKLDNIFITQEGRVKVLDFGIARILSGPVLTMAGTRLGTTAYMPPEQVRGLEVDGRADLFAVGATMFRLLAVRRVHEAPTDHELAIKMSTMPAPKLSTVAPNVPRGIALVVDRALEFAASDRYPNAVTMRDDVRAIREGRDPPFALGRIEHPNPIGGRVFEPTAATAAAPAGRTAVTTAANAALGFEPTAATNRAPPLIDAAGPQSSQWSASGPVSATVPNAAPPGATWSGATPPSAPSAPWAAAPISSPISAPGSPPPPGAAQSFSHPAATFSVAASQRTKRSSNAGMIALFVSAPLFIGLVALLLYMRAAPSTAKAASDSDRTADDTAKSANASASADTALPTSSNAPSSDGPTPLPPIDPHDDDPKDRTPDKPVPGAPHTSAPKTPTPTATIQIPTGPLPPIPPIPNAPAPHGPPSGKKKGH